VEQWQQKQTVDQASWLVGAGVLAPGIRGAALRSLKSPGSAYDDPKLGKDRQPDHMNKFVTTSDDNGGVHINSGIPNRAFYQVAQALGGHAWDRAGKIWYKAMFDLKPSSSFQEFAQTTYDVACALYPESTTEREAVQKAWETVGITVKVKKP
jgi:Zn-dependent metalloprotease